MENLVWQQNRHQKVSVGELYNEYICAVGLDILKFEQASLFCSAWYFNLGVGLELCFEGAKPTKGPTWWMDCVAKLQLAI